jgi:hypothetical protein
LAHGRFGRYQIQIELAQWSCTDRPFTTLIVYYCHSQIAVAAQLSAAPLDEEVRRSMYMFTFGQTLTSAASLMYQTMQIHWLNALLAFVYFTLPTAVMMWVCTDQRGFVERLVLTAAAYAPALVAAIAWDLSRFLVATSLCGLIAILMVFTIEKEPVSIRPIYCLVWVVGIFNLAVPLMYVQNTVGYVIDEGLFPSPLRSEAETAILYYSRNKPLP